jgi:ubiquinone biosynthesis protein COQ9
MTHSSDRLLLTYLRDVPFEGWGRSSLVASLGQDGSIQFPGGAADLALAFGDWADRALRARIAATPEFQDLKTREKIATALRLRLAILAPHREAVRKLMLWLLWPTRAGIAARLAARAADTVWQLAGDQATDFNHYTKRGLVAGIWSATLLVWLSDESADFAKTHAFLDRRIADALKIGQGLAKIKRAA